MCKLGVISQERLEIEVKLILSANRKSLYTASTGTTTEQRMTLSALEWPFHSSSVPTAWEERANVNALYTLSTLKSTPSASRAISAVVEILVK